MAQPTDIVVTPQFIAFMVILAVIRGFGSLRYQRADEAQLRKALESRRRVRT